MNSINQIITVVFLLASAVAGCVSSRQRNNPGLDEARYNTKLPDSIMKKQASGTDFIAEGSIPSIWKLEIDHDRSFIFKSDDGTRLTVLPVKPVTTPTVTSYQSGEMLVNMFNDVCPGKTTGRTEVIVKGITYTGCGNYIYDYRISDTWVLDNISGNAMNSSMFNKGLPVFQINLEDKTVKGHDGCNNFSSTVEILGNRLRFSAITSTRMACRNEIFSSILQKQFSSKTVDYFIRDGKLIFYLQDDTMISFRKGNP